MKINNLRQCDIALPHRCMLRCKMCNIWKDGSSVYGYRKLEIKDYERFLEGLREFVDDPFMISFGGGEPLLSEDLLEIIKICSKKGFNTYFPTNAYLLDDAMAIKIAQAKVSSIGISLDSIEPQMHDLIRGKTGAWQKVMEALQFLHERCPSIHINIMTVIMGMNLDGVLNLVKWVNKHSFLHSIVFQAVQKPFSANVDDCWYEYAEYADLWPKDISKVESIIDELITLIKIHHFNCFKIGNPIPQLELFKLYFNNPQNFLKPRRCHVGENAIQVDTSGNIALCSKMEFIGNMKDGNIAEIWHSRKAEEVYNRISACNNNCHHLVNCFHSGAVP